VPAPFFHAAYAGVAHAADRDGAPVLLWGRASTHVCLGQSQSRRHELVPHPDVPVVRRPLGGGTVWVDENQWITVLIAPLRHAPCRPADWSAWALQPVLSTYHRFGLAATRRDGDIWLEGRKIAGSGAATLGHCAVIASSFLLRFPAARFARCIAGTPGFRTWLREGLAQTMTDWATHAAVPSGAVLRDTYVAAIGNTLGWALQASTMTCAESDAVRDAHAELAEDEHEDDAIGGRRACAGGIKLNADSYLVEHAPHGTLVRELVIRGAVARRAELAT
jgi:lipoate-protein ligase A